MLRKIYNGTLALAGHRHAMAWLVLVSFIESSIFPIPPDVILIPMILAMRSRAFRYATACTVASVLGGLAGYAIGYFLFETMGQSIIAFYHLENTFTTVREAFLQHGAAIVLTAAFTPIPYKLFTITAGVVQLDPLVFTTASVVGRGGRFFLVAGLLWYFGPPIRVFIERRLGLVTLGIGALAVAGFLILEMF
ncbi:MAG: conserved membrane protein of unknown function [Rhodospirillaceae bacterium]|nr:MAG: conserved membrane protein of unknown function [Rhodospirillaceae bacterium]